MSTSRTNRNKIDEVILSLVATRNLNSKSINQIAQNSNLSRQSIYKKVNKLCEKGILNKEKNGKSCKYSLNHNEYNFEYKLNGLNEDLVLKDVEQFAKPFKNNVYKIFRYILTEMVNNAIDHSEGQNLYIQIEVNDYEILTYISDDGIGIFKKIKDKFNLDDISQSILELSKGKTTTDPDNHSGEGIFFSSKLADEFSIIANNTNYMTRNQTFMNEKLQENKGFILDDIKFETTGTLIYFKLISLNQLEISEVFNQFSDSDKGFYKTIVPVKHLEENDVEKFYISRSQAKRLSAGFEKFKEVILDFSDVKEIGQAFADEIFRVYQRQNPNTKIKYINANKNITNMIKRVLNNNI